MKFQQYEETIAILNSHIKKSEILERVSLREALGRTLAKDIIAQENYPKCATAAMDGYACRFEDLKLGKKLKMLGNLPAGTSPQSISLNQNECLKTYTGSLMCTNSDTLIQIENVKDEGEFIIITEMVTKENAVRPVGESYKKDEILLSKGAKISYPEIALLAELGKSYVDVIAKPRIAVLSTGSEIKDLGESLENDAQIYSSNHIAIATMAKLMGCEVVLLPIVKDDETSLERTIFSALASVDILITTGGVSFGDYDFIKSILKNNFEIIVNGAAIKPGRHIKVAKKDEKYIVALPGFSYSAMVCAALYLRMMVDKMLGSTQAYEFSAILRQDYVKKSPFLEFSACNISMENGQIYADLFGKKSGSSAIVNNLNQNSNLLVVPLESTGYKKGDIVKIIKMPS